MEAALRRDWAAVNIDEMAADSYHPPSTWRVVGMAVTMEAVQLFSTAMAALGATLTELDGRVIANVRVDSVPLLII